LQNGEGNPQIPASIRTNIIMGGGNWQVDQEIEEVIQSISAFLPGNEDALWLTADHRPIAFSRALVQSWACAWPIKVVQVQPVAGSRLFDQISTRR
jgi:hypothetical protein